MLTTYRRVFSHPGAFAFSFTGLVARLPIAMMTLGIVLLVSALTGSYALAGQVSAAYIIGNALWSVPHGRLVDRFGQAPVLCVDAVLFGAASGLMVLSLSDGWPLPLPHLLAAAAGAVLPPFGNLVRSRWAHLLDDEAERHTAFAVEGIADEVVFVTGPSLVTFLSTLRAPQSGLVAAIAIGTVGALALAAQRGTEPPVDEERATTRAPVPWAVLVPITAVAAALGCLFGAQEVSTVAMASDAGHRALSGFMLGGFALGSLTAGVVAGAVTTHRSPVQRARTGIALLAVGATVIPLLPGLLTVSLGLFATGLFVAPTLIALFSAIEAASPRSRLNEAMGFASTGMSAGIAPGAWLAGAMADGVGGHASYWVGSASAVVAALVMLTVPDVRARRSVEAELR
ncbi:MAG: MFS transporter [Marmoricola sp.]|nr:MFS transporter [Marmoricola sp.]